MKPACEGADEPRGIRLGACSAVVPRSEAGASVWAFASQSSFASALTRRQFLARTAITAGAFCARLLAQRNVAQEPAPSWLDRNIPWLNQRVGPRPVLGWENCEDLIYRELEYGIPELDTAPEICAFMRKLWIFNRAMHWVREGLNGAVLCYCAGGDLPLTGERQVSNWHTDPANMIVHKGAECHFSKRAKNRCRDAAVLPALQLHIGQHPVLEMEVLSGTGDWQFSVSHKGRSGPPWAASGWRRGPGRWSVDLAQLLQKHGFQKHFAELHFVMSVWTPTPVGEGDVRFRARVSAAAAVVGCLPVIRTAKRAEEEGVVLGAVVVGQDGGLVPASAVRVRAGLGEKSWPLEERKGIWRGVLTGLPMGDHEIRIRAEGRVRVETTVWVRVTDGAFVDRDPDSGFLRASGRCLGPLTGSYQSACFFANAGSGFLSATSTDSKKSGAVGARAIEKERLVQGQREWDRWDRHHAPGERQHFWEALSPDELEERLNYLRSCGWDLLRIDQHWGCRERLDAGGRIAPHGAEQLAMILRVAGKHRLRVLLDLTSHEYAVFRSGSSDSPGGTVPYNRYVEAAFSDREFFEPGSGRFDELLSEYLRDAATLFRDETALMGMTASGGGDAFVGQPRVAMMQSTVLSKDPNHLFLSEPWNWDWNWSPNADANADGDRRSNGSRGVPGQRKLRDWPGAAKGIRVEAIGEDTSGEVEVGVVLKCCRMEGFYLSGGAFAAPPHWVRFVTGLRGARPSDGWTGSPQYRRRLRDQLYLGLVHRMPVVVTWEEQIAEDEHRMLAEARALIDWSVRWRRAPVTVRGDPAMLQGAVEGWKPLAGIEHAFLGLGLGWELVWDGVEAERTGLPGNALRTDVASVGTRPGSKVKAKSGEEVASSSSSTSRQSEPVDDQNRWLVDARTALPALKWKSAGGEIPDRLKAAVPTTVPDGYGASCAWSEDGRTLVVYYVNRADQVRIESSGADAAGNLHRDPQPRLFRVRLEHLPPGAYVFRLWDLELKERVEGRFEDTTIVHRGQTSSDFLLVVTATA